MFNIGISICISQPKESLFTNGIRQNAISLFNLLKRWDGCTNVYFINFGSQKDLSQSPWNKYQKNMLSYEESLTKINVFLSVTAFPHDHQIEEYRKRGVKLVAVVYGNEYQAFVENCLYYNNETIPEKNKGLFGHKPNFDAVWVSPHLYESNKDYLSITHKTNQVKVCPYIWSPEFIQSHCETLGGEEVCFYKPRPQKKICAFEPNISIIKNNNTINGIIIFQLILFYFF